MPTDPTTNMPNYTPADGIGTVVGDFTYTGGGEFGWEPTQTTTSDTTTPTPTPPPPTTPGVGSSTPFTSELDNATSTLDQFNQEDEPFGQLFEQFMEQSEAQQQQANIQATAEGALQEQEVQQTGLRQLSGLRKFGTKTGLSRYGGVLQSGIIQQAEANIRSELMDIDRQEKMAIAEAQQARTERDLNLLQAKLDEIREIRREKREALRDAQEFQFQREKFEAQHALDVAQEARLGRGSSGSGGSNSVDPDFITASDIIKDNPDASEEELFAEIRARTGLSAQDIEALILTGGDLLSFQEETGTDVGATSGGGTNIALLGSLSPRQLRKLAKQLNISDKKPKNVTIQEISVVFDGFRNAGLSDTQIQQLIDSGLSAAQINAQLAQQ